MHVVAIFGPTGVGKTGVAIELSELLRKRGENPVAVSCDALQVYEGLSVLTGVATPEEQVRLEHRLIGFVPVTVRAGGTLLTVTRPLKTRSTALIPEKGTSGWPVA